MSPNIMESGLDVRPSCYAQFRFNFQKPQPIGYYSLTTEREYQSNGHKLKFYKEPDQFPLDLNEGIEKRIKLPKTLHGQQLTNFLRCIIDKQAELIVLPQFVGK